MAELGQDGTIRAATRGSALARWQTDYVAGLLTHQHPDVIVEPVVVQTTGDTRLDVPIHEIGGKGVFVKEVQAAVLDGRADIAVHSAKDLPAITPAGLVLAAIPMRADPRDAMVGCAFADLPDGARVGTGSVRRRAQLANLRPDLEFGELRGNIATRLQKAADFDAIVMAAAALDRLGEEPAHVERLDPEVMLPQVGQGALAVECRADETELLATLHAITHVDTDVAVRAERGFLRELGGDCDLPAGAFATIEDGQLRVRAMVADLDGRIVLRETARGAVDDAEPLGAGLARRLLDERGGRALLNR
ncbi:MAG: hydroxymethylbilane synthase [Acidimicrobiales bacterium]|nr:hydroxymethylbilane synthase [Acidimicrobiales bacterium]